MRRTAQPAPSAGEGNGESAGTRNSAFEMAGRSESFLETGSMLVKRWRLDRELRRVLLRLLVLATLAGAVPATCVADSETGFEHLRAGRIDDALEFFQSTLEANPDDVTALNMVGAIFCIKDDPESSIPYFERALQRSPEFVPARKNLAIAEFDLGRYPSAEANLRELLAVPEAREQASLFLGMISSESGRHSHAVRLLEAAGDLLASQPRALISYARSLQQLGRVDKAHEVLQPARTRDDFTGPDLVDFAQVASSAGLFDEALAALQEAQALDPTLAGLESKRVTILVEAGRDEEARAFARRLATGAPSRRLLSHLAELEESAGELDAAIMALRRAIQAEPKSADGYIELSEFCVRYRNPELALEILDLGLNRIPKSYRLLVQKGITLGQGQRYEAARKAFSEAVGLQTDHSVALTALAVTLMLSEEMAEALEALRAGVERFPDDFYVHYIYGFALDRSRGESGTQRWEAFAEKHFRRSIQLNDKFPSAYFRLGKLLAERDIEEAIRNLELALRLDPTLTAAKYQLGQLYIDSGREDDGARLMQEVGEAKQRELEEEQMPQFRAVKTAPNP